MARAKATKGGARTQVSTWGEGSSVPRSATDRIIAMGPVQAAARAATKSLPRLAGTIIG